jgi:hypothetical protein
MPTKVDRHTVDLSGYPDLVVIYLGTHVNRLTGLKMLLGRNPVGTYADSATVNLPDGATTEVETASFLPNSVKHPPK